MPNVEPLNLVLPAGFDLSEATALQERLAQHLPVGPARHMVRKSVDPDAGQQFIQLIGDVANWLPLKAAAAVFLSTLAKRAADSLWDTAANALKRPDVKPLVDVAESLAQAAERAGPRAKLIVGIDIPDLHNGTVLFIDSHDPAQIAEALAIFAAKADQVSSVMKAEMEAGRAPLGRAVISIEGDELIIRWRCQKGFAAYETRV